VMIVLPSIFRMKNLTSPLDLFSLEGRVALVTGASSGIGRSIAGVLSRAGASVVVVARRADALEACVDDIVSAGGKAAYVAADLSDRAEILRVARAAADAFGAPAILVNAAGVNLREAFDDVSDESWDLTIGLNLSTPFFLARALVPAMREVGWGRIINIASLQSERAFPDSMPYGASKGGVTQLTRAMAEAWSSSGINANAIGPGFFPTELTQPVFGDPTREKWASDQTCIGRNGKLEDLDGVSLFLASRASDYITGQTLFVDGGFTAR